MKDKDEPQVNLESLLDGHVMKTADMKSLKDLVTTQLNKFMEDYLSTAQTEFAKLELQINQLRQVMNSNCTELKERCVWIEGEVRKLQLSLREMKR